MDIEKLKAEFEQSECFKKLEHVAQYTFFEFGAYLKRTDVPDNVEKKCGHLITALIFSWGAWKEAKAHAVPEWLSVGDSLPPVDETVLVCWDYAADIEPEKEYLTLDEDYNEYWPNCQDEPPTHWLPLPKVIKAQEKANEL